ncbi:hypothetical protein MHH56_32240 [Paenibacillus sp. FSL K6-3182]|uniref:hypothetical protein n=1 Tax=Paenibacillus sp. FSL K6-3182 TaxID=2921495 RepID=UPI0030CBDF96
MPFFSRSSNPTVAKPKPAPPAQSTAPAQPQQSPQSPAVNPGQLLQLQQTAGNQSTSAQVGGAATAPQKSPKDVRKDELKADRDAQVTVKPQQLFDGLIQQTSQHIHTFLNSDKQTASLRASLQAKAKTAVEANIDQNGVAEAHEKADEKLYAAEHVAAKGIVSDTLKKYASDTVVSKLPSSQKSLLANKFIEGYNKTEARPEVPLAKQVLAANAQATREATAEAERLSNVSLAQIKKDAVDKVKQSAAFLDSSVNVGDLGKAEVENRHQMDSTLVQPAVINTVYTNKLYEPIKEAVVMKLGVGRGAWRRSKELNAFRQKMKDAAREQSRTDIDNQLDTNALTSGKTQLDKKFTGMMAKKESHATSKGSVDAAMTTEAVNITKRVLPEGDIKKLLKEAAQTSAYGVARTNAPGVKVNEAALVGAEKKAIELLKSKQTEAVNAVRSITKGDKKVPGSKPDAAQLAALAEKTKEQVTADDIAGKAIKKTVEAPTLNKGLFVIGKVLDLAAPNIGDSSSFSFDLKIPVHASGVYVLFGLAGSVGREDKELTMAAEITFGAGFQSFGFDANFRAGFFLESIGTDSAGVMNLTSYGMYRQIRNISDRAADYLWGMGGKSGMAEVEEAEIWAAMIEEKELQKAGNHVDIGLTFKGEAEANAGVAEMGAALGYKFLGRFDKEALEKQSPNGFGGATDLTKLKEKAATLRRGMNVHVMEASAEAKVKLGGNDIAFGLEAAGSVINNNLRSLEITASGSIPFQFGEDAGEWVKIASKVATPVAGSAKNLVGLITSKVKKDKDLVAKGAGSALDTGTDLLFVVPQFEAAGKSLASKIQGDETVNDTIRGWLTGDSSASAIEQGNKIALASSLDLSIGFSKKWDKDNKSKGWEIALEVTQTKSFEVEAGIVNVAVEKSKRLGKLQYEQDASGSGSISGELAGHEIG